MEVVDRATDAAYRAAVTTGADVDGPTLGVALAEFTRVLTVAGALVEPQPAMTVEDAAKLLCELSCSPKLSDPDEDHVSLLRSDAMVKYAWDQAVGAGIPGGQRNAAEQARQLLREHHRRAAAG